MKSAVFFGLVLISAGISVKSQESYWNADGDAGNAHNNQQYFSASFVIRADPEQEKAGSPQPDNKKGPDGAVPNQPVTITNSDRSPVNVNTVKDAWDKTLVISTALLVVVGAFGIRYAIKTVKDVEKQIRLMDGQLKEMRNARKLTSKQVEYIVNTERAWVMGELGWYEKKGPNVFKESIHGAEHTTAYVKLTCKNQGKSPAWIEHVYARLEPVRRSVLLDVTDRTNIQDNGRWGPLAVGEERSRSVGARFPGWEENRESISMLVVVEYRDIFNEKRETLLGYTVTSNGELLRQDGLPERNQNT